LQFCFCAFFFEFLLFLFFFLSTWIPSTMKYNLASSILPTIVQDSLYYLSYGLLTNSVDYLHRSVVLENCNFIFQNDLLFATCTFGLFTSFVLLYCYIAQSLGTCYFAPSIVVETSSFAITHNSTLLDLSLL
jgi:hypothetical protein